MKAHLLPVEEVQRLRRIEALAAAYVREEMEKSMRLPEEGGGLHELAKALGLVQ